MTNDELIAYLQTLTTAPLDGATGGTGPTGPTGPAATAGKIPSAYVESITPFGTTSATLVDVTGMSTTITLDQPVEVIVTACFELATQSGGAASTIAVAINIDGVDHDEYARYLSGTTDTGIGAITHRSGVLSAGVHTIKLRCRRVSGTATPGVNRADMTVMAMQSAVGPTGPTGPAIWAETGVGSNTSLSTDASTSLGAVTISGLDASSTYIILYSIWVTIWKDATLADSGLMLCDVEAKVTTDGSSVATVVFQTTPYFDTSLLPAGLAGATATVAASTGGFTVSATRVAGVASTAVYEYGALRRRKIS